jgi:LCP family protein required for cell wall assembly
VERSSDAGRPARAGLPPLPPNLDPRGRRRASGGRHSGPIAVRRRRRPGTLAAMIISAVLSVSLVVYIGYLWSQVHEVDNKVTRLSIPGIGGTDPQNPTDKTKQRFDVDGTDQNLLIVGNDDRSDLTPAERKLLHTGHDVSLSTDTMMLVHVPADGSEATLISFPRDSYVAIPQHGMNRINAAYALGYSDASGNQNAKRAAGAGLLVQTVENLTGLNIDHYVQVGLIGFYRIAKAIGGVAINLCNAVDDTHAHNLADGQDGGSGFKMSAGKHTLTPVQALEFVRQRHNLTHGDIDRTARQRYFLTAAFRKVASAGTLLNPGKLGNLVKAVDKSLYVDSGLKILQLAEQMANLSANNIRGKAIPFERFWDTSPVGSVEVVDPAKVKAFVNKMIGSTDSTYNDATPADPSDVSVTVINGGAANGAATRASHTLTGAGFHATVGTNAPAQSTSVIIYPKGQEAEAKAVAEYVPGATVQRGAVSTVTLQLGSDGVTAKSQPAELPSPSKSSSSSSKKKSPNAIDAHCIN